MIGAANAARGQHLAAIGRPITNPQSKWLVSIEEAAIVNGQIRVRVMAFAGSDSNYMGIRTLEADGGQLMELWSLDVNGSSPSLLDRTHHCKFNGLQTHLESPITIYVFPPGTPSVPYGPTPTALDMGGVPGEPYGSGDGDGPQP